jgi:hypothetical protein
MATWARPWSADIFARFQQSQAGIRRRPKRAITPISGFTRGDKTMPAEIALKVCLLISGQTSINGLN